MREMKTSILALSLLAFAGTAGAADWNAICCDGGYEYRHPSAWEKEQQRVKDELAAAQKQLADRDREIASLRSSAGDSPKLVSQVSPTQGELAQSQARADELARQLAAAQGEAAGLADNKQRVAELEGQLANLDKQLADRDKELIALRGDLSAEMAKLKEAQRGLIRALRPQIEKGDITVDLNNERMLINLASNYLFGSGQDALKPAGVDALKQVGAVLKDFPEYKVAVDGHTDNRPILSSLQKKFPTNQELSEARAASAAKALAEGGFSGATTAGYADTKPVEPNTTDAGRAKNRRVEILVTR